MSEAGVTQLSSLLARGTFSPDPAPATRLQMIMAQTAVELRVLVRNGEQLILTLVIPLLLLTGFTLMDLVNLDTGLTRINYLAPGIIALAITSAALTSLAITTGFDRRYGVLKRLGATPLSRSSLVAAKTLTVMVVELVQAVIIIGVAFALGWSPDAGPVAIIAVPLLVLLGTAALSGLALLMAGTLKAEVALAAANLFYVVLLGIGGAVFPIIKFPGAVQPILRLLPTGALSTGLRDVLAYHSGMPVRDLITLAAWAVITIIAAARYFHWE